MFLLKSARSDFGKISPAGKIPSEGRLFESWPRDSAGWTRHASIRVKILRFRLLILTNIPQSEIPTNESPGSFCSLTMLTVCADLIANAANRANQSAAVSSIDLAAEIVDVHIHHIRGGVKIEIPNVLDDGRAGNGLALTAHQEFKQREFPGAEVDPVTCAAHAVADAVEFEVVNS